MGLADEVTLGGHKPSPAAPAPVTTIWNYWRDPTDKNAPWPIDLEVVVTYYDPAWGNTWAISSEGPGYLPLPRNLGVRHGDRLRIQGTFIQAQGLTLPDATFTIVERNVPVAAPNAEGKLEAYDNIAHHFVTLDAVFSSEDLTDASHVQMRLVANGYRVNLYHWAKEPKTFELTPGTRVRLVGVFNPLQESRSDSVEFDFWLPERRHLTVLGNIEGDPLFQLPLNPIEKLHDLYHRNITTTHVVGAVTSILPGIGLTVRDATGEVLVHSLEFSTVQVGDVVEAVGQQSVGGADWLLRKAIVKQASEPALKFEAQLRAAQGQTLRTAAQVLALKPEEAAAERPVDILGVVMRPRPNTGYLFIKDTSGTVRVEMPGIDNAYIKKGMRIQVRGKTRQGDFVPYVQAVSRELWGSALLPTVKVVSLEQAMSGQEEGRRIELRGCVVGVTQDGLFTRLAISATTGEFVAIASNEHAWSHLLGAVVAVRGVCQALANDKGQLEQIELHTSDRDDIVVEHRPLVNPFDIPLHTIASLRQFGQRTNTFWVRIRGVATRASKGSYVMLQDGGDGVMVQTKQTDSVEPGDTVEAVGFRGFDHERVVLRESKFRVVATGAKPAPIQLGKDLPANDRYDDLLVQLEGKLLNAVEKDGLHLLLESSTTTFSALLPVELTDSRVRSLEVGSELRLTGIYSVIRGDGRRTHQFRLLLRTPADVEILRLPSWWTPQRALFSVSALGICVVSAVAWLMALRRRVAQQTRLIRAQVAKEATHQRIFDKANDFIFTTDLQGKFVSCNQAGERMTGYSDGELQKLSLDSLLVLEADQKNIRELLDSEGASGVTFRCQLRKRNDKLIWVEIAVCQTEEADGRKGVLGIARDVSARKQLEEELLRARDAAEANTRMKSTFLANMSHEIRTPMNGVIGMSNILLDTSLTREQREFAETIRHSAESLLRVLNDVLDFSKIEAGRLELEEENFALLDVVDGALDLLAPRGAAKGVELAAYVDPSTPRHYVGDAGRIRQVLLNLLGNSLKFTDRGEVILTTKVERDEASHTTLRFEVIDTGAGMDAETAGRLFKPFIQADASTTRRYGGTGLGLAISKQIVELMGGQIGVESALGRGSTFWFTLKLKHGTAPAASTSPISFEKIRGARVLAVDDLAVNRSIVTHYCAAWGLRCDAAESTQAALDMISDARRRNDPYRLIISDFHMPGRDGLTLAEAIREDADTGGIPFILFTSIDRRLSNEQVLKLQISSVVLKPIRVPELKSAVLAALAAEPVAAEAASSLANTPADPVDVDPNLRVLVAEDNAVNQRVIGIQLRAIGLTPVIVADGCQAVEEQRKHPFDLILMDCQMPRMDGFEATQRIRETQPDRQTLIVALTAGAMTGDRERCLEAGMDDYLSKPTKPTDLRAMLKWASARSSLRRRNEHSERTQSVR